MEPDLPGGAVREQEEVFAAVRGVEAGWGETDPALAPAVIVFAPIVGQGLRTG